jgi:hypothetical protein
VGNLTPLYVRKVTQEVVRRSRNTVEVQVVEPLSKF